MRNNGGFGAIGNRERGAIWKAKPSLGLMAAVAAALLLIGAVTVSAQENELAVVITEFEGQVEVRAAGADAWEPAEEGMIVPVDARISTSFDSRAILDIGETTTLTVNALTRMRIDDLLAEEDVDKADLTLEIGRIDGEVREHADRETEFNLDGPVATASVRGTDFGFDGYNLWVGSGSVDLTDRFGRQVVVRAGEESRTDGVRRPSRPRDERRRQTTVDTRPTGSGYTEEPTRTRPPTERVEDETGTIVIEWVLFEER